MPANYVLLERIELNASAASVVFANIPQSGYTDLKVVASAREDSASNTELRMRINGNTSSVYSTRELRGTGSAVSSFSLSGTFAVAGRQNTASSTASTFGNFEVYIPNYLSSSNKSFSSDSVTENNAILAYASLVAGLFSDTTAISSLTFFAEVGNLAANSTFSLYGLAAVGTTPVIAPKATGGNRIDNDGTYWYHTFTSTGTFTPSKSFTAECLVVAAGGGAGNGGVGGGGGGAGGLSYHSGKNMTASTAYTVTIGAGGAGGGPASGYTAPTSGANSVFDTITSNGGGAGGQGVAGSNGGSGGGGSSQGTIYAGGSSNQGNTGGATGYGNAGATPTSALVSGGGGGAGVAGGASLKSDGGNGLNTWSAWATATSTGASGYYAGGGAGTSNSTLTVAGLGGGGASQTRNDSAVGSPGTVNTGGGGGGGGGGGLGYAGGNGGSGIVIIRYPIA